MWLFGTIDDMENVKFTVTSLIIVLAIAGLGFLGYMALESGDESALRQQIRSLKQELADAQDQLVEKDRKIAQLETDVELIGETETVATADETVPSEQTTTTTSSVSSSSSSTNTLLTELQSLQSKKVVLEPGDRGPAVGTIQKFLNAYNKTSGGIDNDFGPGTRTKVEAFQKKQGLTPDGGVGPGTLSKMIAWVKANQ